jgi:hypothetical protein
VVKSLEHVSFTEIAERICALYNEEQDALLLGMLGQEYIIRRNGVFLRGQKAPDAHAAVVLDYLAASDTASVLMPWRSIGDFTGKASPEFRKKVELPMIQYVPEIITRAKTLLPMMDGQPAPSIINSDFAITVRALPKVYLHVELSQETQDFPADAWILFSNNASEFVAIRSLHSLAEMFKERLLGLIRIY